jgi:hypothetical protein
MTFFLPIIAWTWIWDLDSNYVSGSRSTKVIDLVSTTFVLWLTTQEQQTSYHMIFGNILTRSFCHT